MHSTFTTDDLVVYKQGDNTYSGGYTVNSLFQTLGVEPITSSQLGGGFMSGGGNGNGKGKRGRAHQKNLKKKRDNNNSDSDNDTSSSSSSDSDSSDDENDAVQVSDIFKNIGIPAGLTNSTTTLDKNIFDLYKGVDVDYYRSEGGLVPESLFDKLLKLAGPEQNNTVVNTGESSKSKKNNRRQTRKKLQLNKRKTRKRQ